MNSSPQPQLAVAIRYVTGEVTARDCLDGSRAEWPPHPSRVFQAMVACSRREREQYDPILNWLSTLGPPQISVSEAEQRGELHTYVPVGAFGKQGKRLSSEELVRFVPGLDRQISRFKERTFVSCSLYEDTAYLIWPNVDPAPDQRSALEKLCLKVGHIGHSTSAVQMRVTKNPKREPNWVPSQLGRTQIRVPFPGMLDYLDRRFNGRLRPETQDREWVRYDKVVRRAPEEERRQGEFRTMIPLALATGDEIDSISTVAFIEDVRRAICAAAPEPDAEWLTGHAAGGLSRKSHLGLVPLIGTEGWKRKGIRGVGLLIPREIDDAEADRCLAAVIAPGSVTSVGNGKAILSANAQDRIEAGQSWSEPARTWATVTPVALPRWPGKQSVTELVHMMCEHSGVPKPDDMRVSEQPLFRGTPPARAFPKWKHIDRPYYHLILKWANPIHGPLVLGAMRYVGMGVFAPIEG